MVHESVGIAVETEDEDRRRGLLGSIISAPAAFFPCPFPTGGNPDEEIDVQFDWKKYQ